MDQRVSQSAKRQQLLLSRTEVGIPKEVQVRNVSLKRSQICSSFTNSLNVHEVGLLESCGTTNATNTIVELKCDESEESESEKSASAIKVTHSDVMNQRFYRRLLEDVKIPAVDMEDVHSERMQDCSFAVKRQFAPEFS